MNPHHAAALALVGWYLMLPPFPYTGKDRWVVNLEAPLGQWQIYGSYDTADACAQSKDVLDDALHKQYGSGVGAILSKHSGESAQYAIDAQFLMSECIATDDPRLKGK